MLLRDKLHHCTGYEQWMKHWIHEEESQSGVTIYCATYPDNEIFYASSELNDVVESFGRFPFGG